LLVLELSPLGAVCKRAGVHRLGQT